MCIRDRPNTKIGIGTVDGIQLANINRVQPQGAVSYTHLDVYKRQVVNFTADTLTAQVNLNVTEDNFIANNIGMTRIPATVTDGNGNPVEGLKVNFRGTSVTLSSTLSLIHIF